MTLQDLLNAQMDFTTIAAMARRGWAWWLDELATMLPADWRDRLSSRPSAWIEPQATGAWRLWREGRSSEAPPAGAIKGKIGLLAPPGLVLIREIAAPAMPAPDVRRMLSLDIDRLSPLHPDLIFFDMEIVDRGEDDGRQRVLLGILNRADATDLLDQARRDGYAPAALAAEPAEQGGSPRFDFLPQTQQAAGEGAADRVALYWWAGVAALLLVNVAVLIARDAIDVSRLQAMVDAQRPVVESVQRLRSRVEGEDARRRDLLARGERNEPLRMLNTLTRALPAGAWVQHLEWNGQTLRIVGFKQSSIDLSAALRGSGAFTNPRVVAAEPTSDFSPVRPFDITADARHEARP